MENLLLVFDELDDLFAMAGSVWRSALSMLLAVAAFVATGFVFLRMPYVVSSIAAVLLILGAIDALRQRRATTSSLAADA